LFTRGNVRAALVQARKLKKSDSSYEQFAEVLTGLEDGLNRLNRLIKGSDVLNRTEAEMAIEQSEQLVQQAREIDLNPSEFISLQGMFRLRLQELRSAEMISTRGGGRPVALPSLSGRQKAGPSFLKIISVAVVLGLIVLASGGAYYLFYMRPQTGEAPVDEVLGPGDTAVASRSQATIGTNDGAPSTPGDASLSPLERVIQILQQEQFRAGEASASGLTLPAGTMEPYWDRQSFFEDEPRPPHVTPAPERMDEIEREMVRFSGGSFIMGDSRERYADAMPKWVEVEPFYLDKYEVTNAEYRKFLDYIETTGDHSKCHEAEPPFSHTPWGDFYLWIRLFEGKENHPVVHLNWFDAYAYAAWVGKRLPLEAEWEFAVRGGGTREFPWGNTAPTGELANYAFPGSELKTSPVGSLPGGRSPEGMYDLAGNVWEWCWDGLEETPHRIFRGGSFATDPAYLNPYFRGRDSPDRRQNFTGLRCALDAE